MAAITHPEYNDQTEALEVAKAFALGISGKTVIVTGVNKNGIGFSTAEAFASQSPAHLIIAGRNPSKIQECIDALKSSFPNVDYRSLELDLSSQKRVRAGAAEVLSWTDIPTVDILVNSAGVMYVPERTLTEDGVEMHFATNHIGHFLFTCLIMLKLIASAKIGPKGATRVINVSSLSPTFAAIRWSDVNFERKNKDLPESEQPNYDVHRQWGTVDPENASYLPLEGYNQSKVANILFGIGANKRLYEKHGILSVGLHPGIIQTELSRTTSQEAFDAIGGMFTSGAFKFRSLGAGASTSLVAALDPKLKPGETRDGNENYGSYLIDCQISDKAHPLAVSSSEAEKLWKLSEKLVDEEFTW
ncbi:hypothetical protein V496_02734 [Pseudogymnoascus sp. VKM F-4515 (FW-2607)]|nr:hypothetical protein V496_02734 [Pseudogymnoascus sp. VKM F-4515 (FW-2607)]